VHYDFSGYVTKNDLKCGDGRTIRKNAFKDCDGMTVPLVWQHVHGQIGNVLGHMLLENREDGVYGYGTFNDTEEGRTAKEYVKHKDITALSIYANKLVQRSGDVLHGVIREVSLVLAGANPGAMIDNITIAHGDGSFDTIDDEAIIYTDLDIDYGMAHSDDESSERSAFDVIEEMTDEQRDAMYVFAGLAVEDALAENGVSHDDMDEDEYEEEYDDESDEDEYDDEEYDESDEDEYDDEEYDDDDSDEDEDDEYDDEDYDDNVEHSDMEDNEMHKNIFDRTPGEDKQDTLSHSEISAIFQEAVDNKASLKDTFLAHGITNIDYLFPNTKLINNEPQIVNDDQAWVTDVMNSVHKSPFSRLKTIAADITIDEARALGYVKGTKKAEEQFGLLKREVTPQTIYKLQKFDRDDILDITDLDVVAWVKSEMRIKLKEEIARAILVSDGRANSDPHKIKEDKVIPIYKDVSPLVGYDSQIGGHNISSATFAYRRIIEVPKDAPAADKMELLIDESVRARVDYKGSGSPAMYIGPARLAEGLLLKDAMGRRIYESESSLTTAMRVSRAVEVPIFDHITRVENEGEEDEQTFELAAIIVNLRDYTIGLDKGGETTLFDDFDIDYNKYTYLLETRLSGMLTKPFSAIILEFTEVDKEQSAG
jgi:hypothetical protein